MILAYSKHVLAGVQQYRSRSARRSLFTLDQDLFASNTGFYAPFEISGDDRRFLMAGEVQRQNTTDATFLLVDNWFEEVKERMKAVR